tara:strand:- start:2877 stop:2987 length:111 start_codon:yes stop_codon:yes gene_type:complete
MPFSLANKDNEKTAYSSRSFIKKKKNAKLSLKYKGF